MITEAKDKLINRLCNLHSHMFIVMHKSKMSSYLIDKETKVMVDIHVIDETDKYILFRIKIFKNKAYTIKFYKKRKAFRPSIKQIYQQLVEDLNSIKDETQPIVAMDINSWSYQMIYYIKNTIAPCMLYTLFTPPSIVKAITQKFEAVKGKILDLETLEYVLKAQMIYTYAYNSRMYRDLNLLVANHSLNKNNMPIIISIPNNDLIVRLRSKLRQILNKPLTESNFTLLRSVLFYIHYLAVCDFVSHFVNVFPTTVKIIRQNEAFTSSELPPFVSEVVDEQTHTYKLTNNVIMKFYNKHVLSASYLLYFLRPKLEKTCMIIDKEKHHGTWFRYVMTQYFIPIKESALLKGAQKSLGRKWFFNAKDLYDHCMSYKGEEV